MADIPICREMKFSIHAVEEQEKCGEQVHVSASIFVGKVTAVLRALRRASRVQNGSLTHHYVVTHLQMGSAEVGFAERYSEATFVPLNALHKPLPRSSVAAFVDCADALYRGDFQRAEAYGSLPEAIRSVSKDAGHNFSYIALTDEMRPEPLRIDQFFDEQTERFLKRPTEKPKKVAIGFQGTAQDAFDGVLKAIDLTGKLWVGKLVLTGTNKVIECTFPDMTLEKVKEHLDVRVWAEGLAIYREDAALPRRLEIRRMKEIKEENDLRRWRGKVTASVEGQGDDDFDEWFDRH